MKNRKIYLIIGLALAVSLNTRAQQKNVIQQAMSDELKRSMNELKMDSLEKPFYISYAIVDLKSYSIVSAMGAILSSTESTSRTKNVRVLAGNYDFNDESLDDNLFSSPGANDIDVPLDDDYAGIRRALWVTTDNVYRNAARQLSKNKAMLKDQKKSLNDVPHRVFAAMPPVVMETDWVPAVFERSAWENKLRTLTARFAHSDIPTTVLTLNFMQGYEYFTNSEGSLIKVPVRQATLHAVSTSKNEEGEAASDQMTWWGFSPDSFPTLEEIATGLSGLEHEMEDSKKANAFMDEYTGPVLFEGPAVADLFSYVFFQSRDQLAFDNRIASLNGPKIDRSMTMESKIGKQIASPNLTVKVMTALRTKNGKELVGSYLIDNDGAVPPTEMTLIDKGVLKDLLNDRTLTSSLQTPNGHKGGPGVVSITLDGSSSFADLKTQLLTQAKSEGLDYAIIIRSHLGGRMNVVKINVADGKEELQRSARFFSLSLKNLKKLTGSKEERIFQSGREELASYIVPTGLLVFSCDIQHAEVAAVKEENFIPSPLKN